METGEVNDVDMQDTNQHFHPSHNVTSNIISIWKSHFTVEWDTWASIPPKEKAICFDEFKVACTVSSPLALPSYHRKPPEVIMLRIIKQKARARGLISPVIGDYKQIIRPTTLLGCTQTGFMKLVHGISFFLLQMNVRDALNSALDEEMAADSSVFIMGEEVGEYQGAYKAGSTMQIGKVAYS